jgi:hypothetical protein
MATTMHMSHQDTAVRTSGGLDILAGIWLIIAPFMLNYSANGGSVSNDVTVGIVVLVLAGIQISGENYRTGWPSWINALLGVWLIAAPFVLGYPSGSAAMWNDVILGIVVGILSLTGALSAGEPLS